VRRLLDATLLALVFKFLKDKQIKNTLNIKCMTTAIGITDTNRQAVATELAKILADETVLYIKTINAHWNIEGADFYDKHKFFEGQFRELDEIIDSVAERIRSIGHYAPATLKSYLGLTHLTEHPQEQNDSQGFIKVLLKDHESIIMILREHIYSFGYDYHDLGTSDFITGLMEKHEKMAWFLRSHLKN
jgi:starvation-inducible DNA-binding protein